ncbi:MAG: flagellar biosynthetic protein FliR [Deltaproteobacteria bacterium]|nr:flagellar biosynthetic protein FliR [Deltaproteobacteria bacterium]
MELLLVPVDKIQLALICLARVAAIFGSMPIFGSSQVPARAKTILALLLTVLILPAVESTLPQSSFTPLSLGLLVANEALLGIMMGFIARLIFTAVEFGGTIVGYQMGFAAANVYDPQNQRQVSLLSQFQNVIAILIFLALDVHHIFIRVMVDSYYLLPPGLLDFSTGAVPFVMELTSHMFVLAIRFSAPILAVLLLSGLVLGILSRVFPQLNAFMLSFPINIGLAFIIMSLTMDLVVALLSQEFSMLPDRFDHLLVMLRGG